MNKQNDPTTTTTAIAWSSKLGRSDHRDYLSQLSSVQTANDGVCVFVCLHCYTVCLALLGVSLGALRCALAGNCLANYLSDRSQVLLAGSGTLAVVCRQFTSIVDWPHIFGLSTIYIALTEV